MKIEKLLEGLNKNATPANLTKNINGNFRGKFNVSDMKYEIEINKSEKIPNCFIGIFRLKNNTHIKSQEISKRFDVKKFLKAKDELELGDFNVGTHATSILSIVYVTFMKFLRDFSPNHFIIHARNKKRAKFYELLIKHYLITGYNFKIQHGNCDEVSFIFIRNK